QSTHTFQVFRRVDARRRMRGGNVYGDGMAVLEGPQLLERFPALQRTLRQRTEPAQKARPVGVQADVVQGAELRRQLLALLSESVACPGYRRPREVQSTPRGITHHLHDTGTE